MRGHRRLGERVRFVTDPRLPDDVEGNEAIESRNDRVLIFAGEGELVLRGVGELGAADVDAVGPEEAARVAGVGEDEARVERQALGHPSKEVDLDALGLHAIDVGLDAGEGRSRDVHRALLRLEVADLLVVGVKVHDPAPEQGALDPCLVSRWNLWPHDVGRERQCRNGDLPALEAA